MTGFLFALAACGEPAPAPASGGASRVNAVTARPKPAPSLDQFCEVRADAESARPFSYPELDGPAPAKGPGWSWVNVWATWCRPCIEEMPMLVKWHEKLASDGVSFDLRFLSVDEKAIDLEKHVAAYPNTPTSMRLHRITDLEGWIASIGLDTAAVLPIHLFVDAAGGLRCVRMSAVSSGDYDPVKKLLSGP